MTVEIAAPLAARYRFTIDEFERLATQGVVSPDSRLELIGGDIIIMSPIGWKHARCVDNLTRLLVRAVDQSALVRIQNPIALSEYDEPQPDVAVVHTAAAAQQRHPIPAEVWLVIEVADTTLLKDQRVKLPLYARASIQEAWIVDVDAEIVTQYTDPEADGYRSSVTYGRGDTVISTAVAGLQLRIEAQEVLP